MDIEDEVDELVEDEDDELAEDELDELNAEEVDELVEDGVEELRGVLDDDTPVEYAVAGAALLQPASLLLALA